jgi:hypothetical protein
LSQELNILATHQCVRFEEKGFLIKNKNGICVKKHIKNCLKGEEG